MSFRELNVDGAVYRYKVGSEFVDLREPNGKGHKVPAASIKGVDASTYERAHYKRTDLAAITPYSVRQWILINLLDRPEQAQREANERIEEVEKAVEERLRELDGASESPESDSSLKPEDEQPQPVYLLVRETFDSDANRWEKTGTVGVFDDPDVAKSLAHSHNKMMLSACAKGLPDYPEDVNAGSLFKHLTKAGENFVVPVSRFRAEECLRHDLTARFRQELDADLREIMQTKEAMLNTPRR